MKFTKYLNLFAFCFLCFQEAKSQGIVAGKIIDYEGEAVYGAIVQIKNTVRIGQTNETGYFRIESINSGKYEAEIKMMGYVSKLVSFEIKNNETTVLDITLIENTTELETLHIIYSKGVQGISYLPEVDEQNLVLNATKKNDVIDLKKTDANLALNNTRQIFGRIAGIHIWESDASGIQPALATRGLNPNRMWEFNVRMNGYDITPDPMGYPEAYYNPPFEIVDKIEVVRGATSLQFGPQFGGLINYKLQTPDLSKKIRFQTVNTYGSNNLFSTFNYIGGTINKWNYAIYHQKRKGDGWRKNNYFNTDHFHAEVSYAVNNKLKIKTEATYMTYKSQQPGGLTDSLFAIDPRQSLRSRNWFSTPWFMPALHIDYVINDNQKANIKLFGLIAERNSIGYTKSINILDDFKNRQVDRDFYKNIGAESRYLNKYKIKNVENTVVSGVRLFHGRTKRWQKGLGDSMSNYSTQLIDKYQTDLQFVNNNVAFFAENVTYLSKKLIVTAGARFEHVQSTAQGRLKYNSDGTEARFEQNKRSRNFILFGVGAEYHVNNQVEIFANSSQAYRPVLFSDLVPPATTDVIDSKLHDANGFTNDVGIRGKVRSWLNFDASYFFVYYKNRVGTIAKYEDGKLFQYRTNLGTTYSHGAELYAEISPINLFTEHARFGNISMFASLSFIEAKYQDFVTTKVSNNVITETNLKGNQVENAPTQIHRFGLSYTRKHFSATYQFSYVGKAFSDALNTENPNSTATVGIIPSYMVHDISVSWQIKKYVELKSGINNLFDNNYFTRRAGGYPGPGILPSDGRTAYITMGVKL